MSITARGVVVSVICALWACSPAPAVSEPDPGAPEPGVSDPDPAAIADETPAYVARRVIEPTPEMLRAALANDPDAMRDAVAATASCQAATSCPVQFGSCTNWSTSTLCAETCGVGVCICRPIIDCEGEPPEPRGRDTYNSFRVCFDPAHHACTEWTNTSVTFCGC